MNGKHDRCNSLRNELITWLSHREMRLAEETWIKGSPGVQVSGRERSVSLGHCGTWYSCLRLRERGQRSPELDHSHKSGVSLLSIDGTLTSWLQLSQVARTLKPIQKLARSRTLRSPALGASRAASPVNSRQDCVHSLKVTQDTGI